MSSKINHSYTEKELMVEDSEQLIALCTYREIPIDSFMGKNTNRKLRTVILICQGVLPEDYGMLVALYNRSWDNN